MTRKEWEAARAYEDKWIRIKRGAPKWNGMSKKNAKKPMSILGPGFRILNTNDQVIKADHKKKN